ncbi:carboxypeptidase-like regulatory domain-containing protein [Glycomyces sp. L485]|uniref:carboxypeptidase-like regulatory domain-containing protein n=1 Tax=Glycomyces sp. L485 TaxID=2909235 RepID=UPI001F4AA469|nr:carboxypeptidase-like regulatory domain-containing protein [Glycomyces sp. L485]MCH7229732.1 carboxypeptidase-like regulatory domain-containing protein [Glycomyces sp. L485]
MTVAAGPSRTKTNVSRSRRGPRGRLRTRLAGLAAAFGVLLGALAFPAAAQAADFEHWISGGFDPYVDVGGAPATITVEVKATYGGPGPQDVVLTANLSGLNNLASVDVQEGTCTRTGAGQATCAGMQPNEQRQVQFILAPASESELPEGETKTGELKINAGGRGNGEQKTSVTVAGHANAGPKSVSEVSGTVTSNAQPVDGAKVVLTDGDGKNHEATTDSSGNFKFEGSDQGTFIAPGEMTLTVTKDGFEELVKEGISVAEGSRFTQNVTMVAEPVENETTEAQPTTEAAEEPSPTPVATEDSGGISGTLVFLIVIGGLLVVGGIVGIVFLLRGGKDNDNDDEAESFPDASPDHQPTAAQVGTPGVYQAGPAPGQDAPTMIHNGPLLADQEVGAYGAPTSGFGPAYGPGDDSTQVMPQAGAPAPPPPVGPGDTQILSTVKGLDRPGSASPPPMSDATQVMPQANMSSRPQQPTFSDPGATQPYQSPTPPPPPVSRDPYAPQPSQPPRTSYSEPGATQPYQPGHGGMGRDPYAPPSAPPSAPPQPPSAPPADPYAPQPTQAMPQGGAGGNLPPSPYAADQTEGEPSPNSRRREDEERRGWGEWDDRPRSW